MPFVSNSQRKYLFSKEPEVAKKFAAETPKGKKLPEHKKKKGVKHGVKHSVISALKKKMSS